MVLGLLAMYRSPEGVVPAYGSVAYPHGGYIDVDIAVLAKVYAEQVKQRGANITQAHAKKFISESYQRASKVVLVDVGEMGTDGSSTGKITKEMATRVGNSYLIKSDLGNRISHELYMMLVGNLEFRNYLEVRG